MIPVIVRLWSTFQLKQAWLNYQEKVIKGMVSFIKVKGILT